jgi:hypothetical protein
MRRLVAAALVVLLAQWTAAQPRGPKLVVLIVVDQMRADYVDRFAKDWTAGLKRLVTEGALFENAAYPYLATVTCAGHATIATGTFPHRHGIIQNGWWDRERGASVTCTEDPRAKGVGYTVPVTTGDSAWRLQMPTLTDVLRTQRRARVVTIALKDRSAIMLAGHGGDAVTWFSESLDGWVSSSAFSEEPVPAVRAFLAANPLRADFGKIWTRLLPPSRYGYPDDQPNEEPPRGWTRTFPHVLNGVAGSPDGTFVTQWERSPYANAYVVRFATSLVDAFSMGRGDAPDVLGLSFSTPDMIGHPFGPRSQEVQDIFAHLDRALGELFDHLDRSVGRGSWVAALSADHGVAPMPEQRVAGGEDAGRLTPTMMSAIVQERLRAPLGNAPALSATANNDMYFAPGVQDKLRASPRLLESAMDALRRTPGVARVFRPEDVRDAAAARDSLQRAAALSYFPGRSGDLIVALKPGWVFGASGTNHGNASPDEQRVPLIFFGAGVKPGRYKEPATPADLAPTLAAIAGASMPGVEGKVLAAALVR